MTKLIVGIPLGDPSGIGPEIVVKTFNEKNLYEICNMLLIGDKFVVEQALKFTGLNLNINIVTEIEMAKFEYGTIDLIDINCVREEFQLGKVNALCGQASYLYVKKVGELALKKIVDVVVTPPINKEALNIAHTNSFYWTYRNI